MDRHFILMLRCCFSHWWLKQDVVVVSRNHQGIIDTISEQATGQSHRLRNGFSQIQGIHSSAWNYSTFATIATWGEKGELEQFNC